MPTALITGVSSGLGHGLARVYLDRGWHVLGTSRRTPDDLVGRDRFDFHACDLTDDAAVGPTIGALLEGAMDQLDTPCSEALQNHAPSAMGEMEGVASAVGDWVNSCGELSTAAGELDRGHDAKRRLDALFEGGG